MARARRVFLTLTVTRWLPVGFVIGLFTLLALERGLTVAEVALYPTGQAVAILLFELPTSGLADALGRRPVLVAAAVIGTLVNVAYFFAHTFWQFAACAAFMGVYRALDSGPLEAWYVDTVHAHDPDADLGRDLGLQNTAIGIAIAAGSAGMGALVAWHPFPDRSALELPLLVSIALCVVNLAATALLLVEPARTGTRIAQAVAAARETPRVIASGIRLVRHDRVLAGVVCVSLFWAFAMACFETFLPVKLATLVGGAEAAGAWQGPTAAAGWAVFALGGALGGAGVRRWGAAPTAVVARVLNGLGAAAMGWATGPAGLVAAYLVTYGLHGGAGPAHAALLHGRAEATNRATVLSLSSTTTFVASAVALALVGAVAERTSVSLAMVAAGLFSVLGAVGYIPAWRAARRRPEGAQSSTTVQQQVV